MAKFIRDLLDAEEPLFTTAVRQLEEVSGKTGADTKLIGDITAMAHESMRALGLNPAASTGEEAVELCKTTEFDIVLMDVRMPGLSGVDAFREIRRYREGIKVILMRMDSRI